jgi:hypothetical protein
MEEEEGMGSALDLDALGDVEGEASAAVEFAEVLGGILDKVADTEAAAAADRSLHCGSTAGFGTCAAPSPRERFLHRRPSDVQILNYREKGDRDGAETVPLQR